MHPNTANRSVTRGRWTRVVAGVFTLLALSAVPVLGFSHLGSDLASLWGSLGEGGDETLAPGPVAFDAPTATILMEEAQVRDARPGPSEKSPSAEKGDVTVLDDWAFTDGGGNS